MYILGFQSTRPHLGLRLGHVACAVRRCGRLRDSRTSGGIISFVDMGSISTLLPKRRYIFITKKLYVLCIMYWVEAWGGGALFVKYTEYLGR